MTTPSRKHVRPEPPSSATDTPLPVAMPPRRPRRPPRKAFDALILLVILGLIGYGVYRYFDEILEALYSRTAMVVLVVMVIEFLILKSFDRTRLYRIENQRLVRRRMADLQAMREAESALTDLIREPPMAPTEVLRARQLKGSMVAEDVGDEEDEGHKPLREDEVRRFAEAEASRPETPVAPPTEESGERSASTELEDSPMARPFTPPPGALVSARRSLRHLRKRIY